MKICSFRVRKFRNVVDSGEIVIDDHVTCLVGKNEAGKSALLEALYLFNPAYNDKFDVEDQYPRWLKVRDRKSGELKEVAPISVDFQLDEDDKKVISEVLGEGVLLDERITVERKYGGNTIWTIKYSEETTIANILVTLKKENSTSLKKVKTLGQLHEVLDKPIETGTTNGLSEDEIEEIKSHLEDLGISEISVRQKIVDLLKARLPRFFRFTNYSTLPGRIDFRDIISTSDEGPAQSGIQTAKALLELAGTDIEQLGDENYELRKGELEAVQIDLTNQVFEYWKQNPDLEVLIDVDKETISSGPNTSAVARYLDIRLRDRRTGYSNNFRQRSSGFQWFFSFLAAFSEFEGKDSPIVLLDEPALTLHGKAQGDFLRFINERLAPFSPVLYTTHSPFMIEPDRLDRARIIEDQGPPTGATSSEGVFAIDKDSLFPLQAALGYDIAQNLFVGPNNLVVEGTSDFIFLTTMSTLCKSSNRNFLDERWRILPAGGASNIPTFVSLVGPKLDITVLADSDTKGMQRINRMIEQKLLEGHRLIHANIATKSNEADIEDLFSAGDYLKLYNSTFGNSLKVSDLPKGDRIVKRIEGHLGEKYDHGAVAEKLLRQHHEFTFSDSTLDRFEKLFNEINSTISQPTSG